MKLRLRTPEGRYLSSLNRLALGCSVVLLLLTLVYVWCFESALLAGELEGYDGFISLFITDTLRYLDLVNSDEWTLLTFAIAGVKNAIAPSLLWDLAGGSWYVMAWINAAIMFASLRYLAKLCWHFQIQRQRAATMIVLLGLLPSVLYFSIGSLKELPTLLALTGFLYHYLKGDRLRWLLWAVALIVLRYQLAAILPLFVLIDRFAKRPLRVAALFLLVVSMAFPLFSSLNVLSGESTQIYRDELGTEATSGAQLESIRDGVPILSAAAIVVRTTQSALDPLLTFMNGPYLFQEGLISIEGFAYLSTLLLTLPAWWRAARRTLNAIRVDVSRDVQRLYGLVLLYVVPVGGFSFVHGRYLFPVTALLLIAGVPVARRAARSHRSSAVPTSDAGGKLAVQGGNHST